MRTTAWLLFGWLLLQGAADAFAADPLDIWHVRNPLPHANNLRAVCYGNGLYVAVGEGAIILTSADGNSGWALQDSGITNSAVTLGGVAYGNGNYVAIGTTTNVLSSTDGTNWIAGGSGFSTALLNGIAFGSGKFTVVGSRSGTNFIMTSTDGTSWSLQNSTVGRPLFGVTFAQGQFVAVGGTGGTSNGVIITSPDAITWTTRHTNIQQQLAGVAGSSSGFVAVGGTTTAKSSDGATWTDAKDPSAPPRASVAYGNNVYAMIDQTVGGIDYSTFFSSPDGNSWSNRFTSPVSVSAMTYGSSNFVAVGTPNAAQYGTVAAIYTSADGTNWLPQFSGVKSSTDTLLTMNGAAYGNGRFVVVGESTIFGALALSTTNLVDWLGGYSPIGGGKASGVIFSSNLFVVVGDGGGPVINTSADGQNWASQFVYGGNGLNAITRGGSLFVAVGNALSGDQQVLTSLDATNWDSQTPGFSQDLYGVAFGNSAFVAVGADGVAARSGDGTNWTSQTLTATNHLRGVAFGNGQFVVVGDSGRIFNSSNGTTWTNQSSGTTLDLKAVAWINGQFLAVGGRGVVLVSTNGVNWSKPEAPADVALLAITAVGDLILVAGENGVVLTSTDGKVWTARDLSPSFVKAEYVSAVGVNDTIYVATQGAINYSRGGKTWYSTLFADVGMAPYGVTYVNGLLIAVGNMAGYLDSHSAVSVSDDLGMTWSASNLGLHGWLNAITYGNGTFVAVGAPYGNSAVFTSTNGGDWTLRNPGVFFELDAVSYGNGLFVASGDSGVITSPDGITWTQRSGPSGGASVFGNGIFIVSGNSNYVSVNGTNWTNVGATPTPVYGLTYGNGTYLGVGAGGTLMTSTNGTNWVARRSGVTEDLFTAVFLDDSFFALGDGTAVLQSDYVASSSPAIVQQPVNRTNFAGSTATFTLACTGRQPLRYQWLKNNVPLADGTASTLALTNVQAGGADTYAVIVANEFGSIQSSNATLTVVTVTVAPADLSVFTNSTASFSAVVAGATPTGYQWRHDTVNIGPATSATLDLLNVQPDDAGDYDVIVTFPFGKVTNTPPATLNVFGSLDEVSTYLDPSFQYVPLGSTAGITNQIYGPLPASYQWRTNDVAIPNATNAILMLTNVQFSNDGDYTCVLTYPQGSLTNGPATLSAYSQEPPIITRAGFTNPNAFQLTFNGLTNRSYAIQFSDLLTFPATWQDYDLIYVPAVPATYVIYLSYLPVSDQYFFRLILLPP